MGKKSKEETTKRVEQEKAKKEGKTIKKEKKEDKVEKKTEKKVEKKAEKVEKKVAKPAAQKEKKEDKTSDKESKADAEDTWVPDESNMTAFQLKDRKQKTCFVGNLPLETTAKQLRQLFGVHGKVDKVWFRSVATIMDSKLPQKAKIIKKEYSDQKSTKNAYVLFDTTEQAKKAADALNQHQLLTGNHIRVDIDLRDSMGSNQNDYECTVFIGNLPFVTNEEELRRHFADVAKLEATSLGTANAGMDGILNVRVIRDPVTHIGKGIAYVQFTSKMLMRLAIEKKTGSEFKGRQIRIKKAVAPQRLEKKKMRTEQKQVEKAKAREEKNQQADEDEALLAQKDQDMYQSDDSFEERYGKS